MKKTLTGISNLDKKEEGEEAENEIKIVHHTKTKEHVIKEEQNGEDMSDVPREQ